MGELISPDAETSKTPFFCKGEHHVFASDQIASIDCSRLDDLSITVHLRDGSQIPLDGILCVELLMQVKPSMLEGRKSIKFARHVWAFHNLVGHPLTQILAWMGLRRLAFKVHDATVPRPKILSRR